MFECGQCLLLIILMPVISSHDEYTIFGDDNCGRPLGMENGLIPDSAISASSSYDLKSVGPQNARIRQDIRGGAWCPKNLISSMSKEYLEVSFETGHVITGTETQGRFGNGRGQEFAEYYYVEYTRNTLNKWITYRDYNGSKLLQGNTNTYLPSFTRFDMPFVANKIRFYPYAQHPRTACLRVELYGCMENQGIESYSAPPGATSNFAGGSLLNDVSYDGLNTSTLMIKGLGQLTDTLFGFDDFEEQFDGDVSGSRWVGWNSKDKNDTTVELKFHFYEFRQFQSIALHTNNMFTKDVQVFVEAEVFFSLEGVRWQTKCEKLKPKQDRVSERSKLLTIDLKNRTAKSLKVLLHYSNKWIMLSEVFFISELSDSNVTDEYINIYYKDEYIENKNNNELDESKVANIQHRVPFGLVVVGIAALTILVSALILIIAKKGKRRVSLLHKHPGSLRSAIDVINKEPFNVWNDQYENKHGVQNYCDVRDSCHFKNSMKYNPRENYYTTMDILQNNYSEIISSNNEQKMTPGHFTCIKLPEADPPPGVAILLDFPRRKLRTLDTLGEAPYGVLQLCEAEGIEQYLEDGGCCESKKKRVVLVKTLWRGYTDVVKNGFVREATWLAGLRHPQVARILGLSLSDPPCAALELGELGDLPSVLRSDIEFSCGSLMHMATQISAGMKFLESLDLIHRDLAARNCTVTKKLCIKIGDHAMHMTKYRCDYYENDDGVRLPVRWMSWESILMGHFTSASDVWSFGCTLWEVLTRCSMRPLAELTHEQVIENASNWRNNTILGRTPPKPDNCTRELYDLMQECWSKDPALRPRFSEINLFLQKKCVGFIPPN